MYSSGIVPWRDLSHTLHNFHLLKAEPYFWAVTCNCTDFHFGLNSVHLFYVKRFWTLGLEHNSFVICSHRMSGRNSNISGSRYSHSRPPRNEAPPSINGSYVKPGINPSMQQQQMTRPLATSQVVPETKDTIQQNSLLNYFSQSTQVLFIILKIHKKPSPPSRSRYRSRSNKLKLVAKEL